MTINEIELLPMDEANFIAEEKLMIKGFNVYFIDFCDRFGYSAIVFADNGKQIHYANEYELHNHYWVEKYGKDFLKEKYIEKLNAKLFTDKELMQPVESYDEFTVKEYFLRNYWIQMYDYETGWFIGNDLEREKHFKKVRKDFPVYNRTSFCWMKEECKEVVEHQREMMEHLYSEYEKLKTSDFRNMIARELANHEACITCSAGDALRALGIRKEDLTDEQKQIVREELQKQIDQYYL